MAGLYKKEVVIRPTSTVTVQAAIDWTKDWLNNTFQDTDSNKNEDGSYIDYFFGDVFDARTGNIIRVFSDACSSKYDMTTLVFEVLDTSKFTKNEDFTSTVDVLIKNDKSVEDRISALEVQETQTTAVVI